MHDNFTYGNTEQLIRYMDGELSPQENVAMETLLEKDNDIRERYQQLLAARDAIKAEGLKQKMLVMHAKYYAELKETEQTGKARVIRTSFGHQMKLITRIAAVFILVIAAYGVYQYSTATTDQLFADNYISYHLPVTRGEEQARMIDSLYAEHDFTAVIKTFENANEKTAQDYFLAAIAYLETGNADAAILHLKQLQAINVDSAKQYFVQETEYYLLLAFLKAGLINEAEQQLNTITANKEHMFYKKAKEISSTKLMILKWKS